MLNAFDYEKMWKGFFKRHAIKGRGKGKRIINIGDLMNQYKKDYIERNKNNPGYHDVEKDYQE